MSKAILILHVLAATVWVGGHIVLAAGPLRAALKSRDRSEVEAFEKHYEKIGKPSLLLLILTGFGMGFRFDANPLHWFSFAGEHNTFLALKTILLLLTIASALDARFRISKKEGESLLKAEAFHIRSVTLLGIMLVLVAVYH